jgi:hypothetical protein
MLRVEKANKSASFRLPKSKLAVTIHLCSFAYYLETKMEAPIRITQDQLKTILLYVPKTGALLWTLPRGRMKANSPAGSMLKDGKWLRVNKTLLKASDVIYFWMTGEWKRTTLVDGVKSNLCWINIAPLPDKVEDFTADEPYTILRRLKDGSWRVEGNMGVTIDQMLDMLQIEV